MHNVGGSCADFVLSVYTTLDLQQLATKARQSQLFGPDDVAISILAEVTSLYPGRGHGDTTEALVNAGSLALGREPVKDTHVRGSLPHYSGWGILTPWKVANPPFLDGEFPLNFEGWHVGRISQEHGVLVWAGPRDLQDTVTLTIGQKVRVWPNHSCIAGSGFDWYLIVDSRKKGEEDVIVDVWPRWRGW